MVKTDWWSTASDLHWLILQSQPEAGSLVPQNSVACSRSWQNLSAMFMGCQPWPKVFSQKVKKVTFCAKWEGKSQEKRWRCVVLLCHQARAMIHSCLHSSENTRCSPTLMSQCTVICHFQHLAKEGVVENRFWRLGSFTIQQSSQGCGQSSLFALFLCSCPQYFCTKPS